jgi:hypothetical protein
LQDPVHTSLSLSFFLSLALLKIGLRVLHLSSKQRSSHDSSPFVSLVFLGRVSCFCPGSLRPLSSYLCLLSSWDYKVCATTPSHMSLYIPNYFM